MTDRFHLKDDGIQDKETDRIFTLDKNLLNLLNTLDKMNKQNLIRIYAQDKYIQKLEARLEEVMMDKRFELVIGTMEFAGNEEHITIADHLDNKVFMSNEEIVDKLNVMEEAKQTLIICNGTLHKKITSLKTKISQLEWEIDELKERGLTMKYEDDLKTMNDDIKEIYLILVELESLETGENADYTDIVTDIAYCKVLLKNRLTSLKNKQ